MISRHSSVLRPRVLVSTPSACHSGASGLPMPKAGSSRPPGVACRRWRTAWPAALVADARRDDVHAEPHAPRAPRQGRHRRHRFQERRRPTSRRFARSNPRRRPRTCRSSASRPPLQKTETPHSPVRSRHPCVVLPPDPAAALTRGATSRAKRSRLPFICSGRMPGGTAQVTRSVMPVLAHKGCQFLHAVLDIANDPMSAGCWPPACCRKRRRRRSRPC